MSDTQVFQSKSKVRARRVKTKTEEVVTTAGRVTASQHSYIVERDVTDPFTGTDTVEVHVLSNDEFHERWEKDTRTDDIKKAREEGFAAGWDKGWEECHAAAEIANASVNDSTDSPVDADDDDTEPADGQPPVPGNENTPIFHELTPVGDSLEDEGPKVRELPKKD